jgi:hypothetical protein
VTVALTIGLAAAVAAACWAYFRFAEADLQRLADYELWSSEFFENARPLVNDQDTPDEVLDLLQFANNLLTNKRASRRLLKAILDVDDTLGTPSETEFTAPLDAFFERRPELGRAFVRAMTSGLFALTFVCGRDGARVRREILKDFGNSEPTRVGRLARQFEVAAGLPGAAGAVA